MVVSNRHRNNKKRSSHFSKGEQDTMVDSKDTPKLRNSSQHFGLAAHAPKRRILIVDDEDDIRIALAQILRLEGYVAEEADSGDEALELLEHETFDLMVLDMRMPGMSGVEVIQQVRIAYPDLFVVVLTGQATLESAILTTKSDGVVDYLLKPVKTDEFVAAITRALRKKAERVQQQKLVSAAAQILEASQQFEINPPEASLKTPLERFIHVFPLTLDCQKRVMTFVDENPARMIELTKGETAVLATLMMYPNQTLSCHDLVTQALKYDVHESEAESVIRPYVFRLRRKLERSPKKPDLICTIRRRGYRFMAKGC
jgi:DNA-binding response OmpR family regulator